MQITLLKSFIAVVECGNFSQAADKLYISQSSLSKYIKSIEDSVGVPLIIRSPRKLCLTTAGERFILYAQRIVEQFDLMLMEMNKYCERYNTNVRIACMPIGTRLGYTEVFLKFRENRPDLDVEIFEMEMAPAMQALNNSDVDIAVVRTNLVDLNLPYTVITFHQDELLAICNKSHKFASRKEITLDELLSDKLVMQMLAMYELRALLKKHNISPGLLRPSVVTNSFSVVYENINKWEGVSILTQSVAMEAMPYDELAYVRIAERPRLSTGVVYRNEPLPQSRTDLINFMMKEIKKTLLLQ